MAAISSKAYGTFFVKVFQMHDATMGSFVAAVSMKGISMSAEQNFEDNAIGLRRSSIATLKPMADQERAMALAVLRRTPLMGSRSTGPHSERSGRGSGAAAAPLARL